VLDIGCGTGRLGTELRRGQAKAKVTFLDNDEQQIEKLKLKSGCKKVVAEATNLPFEYESFAKTLSVFSAIHWAETPYERIQSLNEALRVTEVGGSLFVIPAFSSLHHRQRLNPKIEQLTHRVKGKEMTVSKLALKTWALQDYVMLHSLLAFAKQSYCSITWCGTPKPSLRQVDNYSAIIDKHRSIPPEVFAGNLAVAERFMANTTN
ncbi:MAG: class I SAM-dependent methyltransferase, partial [Candidatus Saccharimonadales bacterium]